MGFYDEIAAPQENTFKYYADGQWKVSASGNTVSVLNPSRGNIEAYKVQACTQVSATPTTTSRP
jgi:glyceraldehyde-3-phosphate dehydrogenase (NADP+)